MKIPDATGALPRSQQGAMNSTAKRPNRFLVELPPPLREGLDLLAQETGRKRQDLIREAIQDWLEKRRVLGRG